MDNNDEIIENAKSPLLLITFFAVVVSVMTFFLPMAFQQKEPAIADSVEQNMVFLNRMVERYIKDNKRPPDSLKKLINTAKKERYNKTFFNPVRLNGGNIDSQRMAIEYSALEVSRLGPSSLSELNAGKTGYYTDGSHYTIYGHLRHGELITRKGQILSFGNF